KRSWALASPAAARRVKSSRSCWEGQLKNEVLHLETGDQAGTACPDALAPAVSRTLAARAGRKKVLLDIFMFYVPRRGSRWSSWCRDAGAVREKECYQFFPKRCDSPTQQQLVRQA